MKGKVSNSPSDRSLNGFQVKEQILKGLIIGKDNEEQNRKKPSEKQN